MTVGPFLYDQSIKLDKNAYNLKFLDPPCLSLQAQSAQWEWFLPLLWFALYCILRCIFVLFHLLGSPTPFVMTFTCFGDDKYICLRPFMIGYLSFHDVSRLTVTQSYKVALLTKALCGKSVRINSQQYVLVLVSFCRVHSHLEYRWGLLCFSWTLCTHLHGSLVSM